MRHVFLCENSGIGRCTTRLIGPGAAGSGAPVVHDRYGTSLQGSPILLVRAIVRGFQSAVWNALHRHHDLANLLVRLHVAMRFHDLGKRKDSVDARFEAARLDMIEDILFSLRPQFRDRKYFTEGVSANR